MLIFSVALSNSTLAIALLKTRAKPIQTPKTPACICSFWDKKVMREFLRKKDMREFCNKKAGRFRPAHLLFVSVIPINHHIDDFICLESGHL